LRKPSYKIEALLFINLVVPRGFDVRQDVTRVARLVVHCSRELSVSVKDIVVGLALRDPDDKGRDYSLSMGAALDAQVTALAYALEPSVPSGIYPEFTADLMQRYRAEAKAEAEGARARFLQAAERAGVRHDCQVAHATVQQATADFALRLRTADVAVLAQHRSDDLERVGDLFAEAALFRSGRPMIVVPKDYRHEYSAARVLIAWDASVHATRAVAAALPFLSTASEIEVLTIREANKGEDLRGAALVKYLQLHDLNAELTVRDDPDIPKAIVRQAEVFRASLTVMGGYGHSRFREFVFGGATRYILRALQNPVLMVH
jgi:nucleotide-binding universal stress UspA family protein